MTVVFGINLILVMSGDIGSTSLQDSYFTSYRINCSDSGISADISHRYTLIIDQLRLYEFCVGVNVNKPHRIINEFVFCLCSCRECNEQGE